jgi:hypothetical protein
MAKAKAAPSVDDYGLAFGSVRFARFVERLGGGELLPVAPIAHSLSRYGDAEKIVNGLISTGLVRLVKRKDDRFLQITDAGGLALIVFYTGG